MQIVLQFWLKYNRCFSQTKKELMSVNPMRAMMYSSRHRRKIAQDIFFFPKVSNHRDLKPFSSGTTRCKIAQDRVFLSTETFSLSKKRSESRRGLAGGEDEKEK